MLLQGKKTNISNLIAMVLYTSTPSYVLSDTQGLRLRLLCFFTLLDKKLCQNSNSMQCCAEGSKSYHTDLSTIRSRTRNFNEDTPTDHAHDVYLLYGFTVGIPKLKLQLITLVGLGVVQVFASLVCYSELPHCTTRVIKGQFKPRGRPH